MRELLLGGRQVSLTQLSSALEQQQQQHQQHPLSTVLHLGSSANIGRALLGVHHALLVLVTSLTSNPLLVSTRDPKTLASLLAALRITAQQTLALASSTSLLPLSIWLLVDTVVGVLVVIGYVLWCIIFGVGALAVGFA